MAHTEQVITLLDDEGQEHKFEVVDVVEVDEREYVVLLSLDRESDDEAAVVFRVEGDTLVTIEDDEEFNRVVEALEEDDGGEEPEGGDPVSHTH